MLSRSIGQGQSNRCGGNPYPSPVGCLIDTTHPQRTEPAALGLSWLDLNNCGVRVKPGRRGLTLDEIEIGLYAANDDDTPNLGLKPRGAVARKAAPKVGHPYTSKAEGLGRQRVPPL